MKYARSLLVFFGCLLISYQVSAKVYKWTDNQGQVHYSEQPSATQSNEVIKPKIGHSDPVSYSSYSSSSATAEEAAQKTTATPPPPRKKNPEACAVARKNQTILQTSVRVQVVDDKGQHRYLAPEELKEKMAEANRVIEEQCEK